ncbi:hypothetical protein ACJJJB_00645 [Microbulbifer sp. ANSA001]|uniref:hypothetical protein n=1 Tax=Microbulbifer TaxID=48073 RepID=UPI0003621ED0|nr:hypothetical protein [Microbulbifer variabilis]
MKILKPALISISLLAESTLAEQSLKVVIMTPDGETFQTKQILENRLTESTPVISIRAIMKEYQAIRCNGPWGAIKYKVMLSSGPGIEIFKKNDRVYLQFIEYSVINKDLTVASMGIHCIDTEPKQIFNTIGEIDLMRNIEKQEELELSNGYILKYHYTPK